MDEKELEPKISLDDLDNPEVEVKEEEPAPKEEEKAEELAQEEASVEEPSKEEEAKEEQAKEEPAPEEAKPNPLKEAIALLANASNEEFDALDDEAKEMLEKFKSEQDLRNIESRLSFISKAIDAFQSTIVRSLDDNEEFRTLSKLTLQKNVSLLEDQVKMNQFNKILRPLATLYSNYEFMLEAPIDEKKTRSNIEGILEEIEALLEDYGAEKITAKVGDDFDALRFKIAKKIETNDPNLDKKVAAVKACGFRKEKIVFVPLRADMYVYVEQAASTEQPQE